MEAETEANWEMIQNGVPGNLKLLEGLLYVDPTNDDLLLALTKGYGAYGFAVSESLHLAEKFKEADFQPQKKQAIYHYSKAVQYGLRGLQEYEISDQDLFKGFKQGKGAIARLLNRNLDRDDQNHLELIIYTAQAWGGLINLQRDNYTLMSQLNLVKELFDWPCSIRPNIYFGLCDIFYATYYAGRPKMLGGDPVKGKNLYLKAIKKYPKNLLIRVAYLQFSVIPSLNEEEFQKQAAFLDTAFTEWEKKNQWEPDLEGKKKSLYSEEIFQLKRVNIFNAIAKKRFEIMKKHTSDLF